MSQIIPSTGEARMPDSPVQEYRCFSEVMFEVKGVFVADLAQYTQRLSPQYQQALYQEPSGVYIPGSLNPLLLFGGVNQYYTQSQLFTNPDAPNVCNYEDFVAATEAVVDRAGRQICLPPRHYRTTFSPRCSFHYSAIHMALICAWETLRHLYHGAMPRTEIAEHLLREETWVLPEHAAEIDAFEDHSNMAIRKAILDFVGQDIFAVYTVYLNNTTLRIEKGNDFRIIEYYRQIFENYERERFEKLGY